MRRYEWRSPQSGLYMRLAELRYVCARVYVAPVVLHDAIDPRLPHWVSFHVNDVTTRRNAWNTIEGDKP